MSAYEIIYYLHYYSDLITAILCLILIICLSGILIYTIKSLGDDEDEDNNV